MLPLFLEFTHLFYLCVSKPCVVLGDNGVILDTPIDFSQVIETSDADEFPELERRRPHKARDIYR